MDNLRKRVFKIIEPAEKGDSPSNIFDISILVLIIINVIAVIIESLSTKPIIVSEILEIIEIVSIIIFTIEYVLRIVTADFKYPSKIMIISIVRYCISFMALIDLFAILPFYIPMLIAVDLRFLRILRLTRLLRVLKINRYTNSLKLIVKVLKRKKEELIVTIFVMVIMLLLSASIMYYLETDAQPEAFPNIIAAFWWAIATLTTVGYGDVYPVTVLGKVLSAIIAVIGIGIVALPTGIISSGFIEEINKENIRSRKNRRKKNIRNLERRKQKRRYNTKIKKINGFKGE
ncbi:MAG: ion transporter [Spirochaetales bacterium]|uniref:Ion transporter n=1 Tax=Candidatus Thalassospirochaeta sargassi TaxID=3119039 RepID=A0AAJ1MJ45_9SPIO|nr:ion transporter [Spirochaetales bacterium]